MPLIALI